VVVLPVESCDREIAARLSVSAFSSRRAATSASAAASRAFSTSCSIIGAVSGRWAQLNAQVQTEGASDTVQGREGGADTAGLEPSHGSLARTHPYRKLSLTETGLLSGRSNAFTDLGRELRLGIRALVLGSFFGTHGTKTLVLQLSPLRSSHQLLSSAV
jgi:hypothetical protein